MRNVGGALAQRKLTRALISTLRNAGRPYQWLHSSTNVWSPMIDDDADVELYLRGLSWQKGSQPRTLIYNLTVPLVRNDVDLCLLKVRLADMTKETFSIPRLYLALGELKGGIDPAGADEHWKTARSALNRIRTAFAAQGLMPQTFFIGAAIEKKMANEIWNELQDGSLSNAANLTADRQIAFIFSWLCNL
ncbi:Type-2 restriction enzyme BsoBI [Thermoflexales bacterium]|nr:Type-2 restriction enzyme BsoBI [Thermoflexales bacterium]